MPQTTLGPVSDSRVTSQTVRYRERLWVPWWWWPIGLGLSALLAAEVNMGVRNLPDWLPYAMLAPAAIGVLLSLGRMEVQVIGAGAEVELVDFEERETRLREALAQVDDHIDARDLLKSVDITPFTTDDTAFQIIAR